MELLVRESLSALMVVPFPPETAYTVPVRTLNTSKVVSDARSADNQLPSPLTLPREATESPSLRS